MGNKTNNDYDLSDIKEKIVFHHDCEEDEILKMVKNEICRIISKEL